MIIKTINCLKTYYLFGEKTKLLKPEKTTVTLLYFITKVISYLEKENPPKVYLLHLSYKLTRLQMEITTV